MERGKRKGKIERGRGRGIYARQRLR